MRSRADLAVELKKTIKQKKADLSIAMPLVRLSSLALLTEVVLDMLEEQEFNSLPLNERAHMSKVAIQNIYPDAFIFPDPSGKPSADVAVFRKATKEDWPNNGYVQIGSYEDNDWLAWIAAAKRLK